MGSQPSKSLRRNWSIRFGEARCNVAKVRGKVKMAVSEVDSASHQVRPATEPQHKPVPSSVISPRHKSTTSYNMLAVNPPARQVSTGDFGSEIERLVSRFKNDLTRDQQDEIENVSLGDLHEAIKKIQEKQRATKSYRNLKKIEPFVIGMAEYGKVIAAFTNAVPIVAFVWVC